MKNKKRGRKIIIHHSAEGTSESNSYVNDLKHPGCRSQILDTRMGFPCPFHNVLIHVDAINLAPTEFASDLVNLLPLPYLFFPFLLQSCQLFQTLTAGFPSFL